MTKEHKTAQNQSKKTNRCAIRYSAQQTANNATAADASKSKPVDGCNHNTAAVVPALTEARIPVCAVVYETQIRGAARRAISTQATPTNKSNQYSSTAGQEDGPTGSLGC